MKIIFLDIDGVITSARSGWMNMDIYAVNFMIWLCEQLDMKIVISSTWRYNTNREFWNTIFMKKNIHDDYRTPSTPYDEDVPRRGGEIKAWLDNHPEVTEYLIIDDDSDILDEQKPHFIQTDSMEGLLFSHMIEIIEKYKIGRYFKQNDKMPYIHKNMFGVNNTSDKLMNKYIG